MALKVLSALDTAKTQLYHFKAIVIAGMGLFTDAYDFFCILPTMKLIGRVYYDSNDPNRQYEVPVALTSIMVAIAFLGAAIGQLLFGRLGDLIGRRRVYGLSLFLMVLSSIGCGFSMGTSRGYVLGSLVFFRFVLGFGIGGDYPLSATIMSEFANKKTRGSFIAAVFSMQGPGILASCAVTMVICSIFNVAHPVPKNKTPESADLAWRLILMIGAIPAGLTFYWRMMMPETARYTALVEHNVQQAVKDMEKVLDVSLSQIAEDSEYPPSPPPSYPLISKPFFRRHGRDLLACATAWFLIDLVFYSTNLVQSQINDHYLPRKKDTNAFEEAYGVAKFQAIIAVCSTIPGYWATIYYIDRIGRVKIQIIGFFFMTLAFITIGISYYFYWHHKTNLGFLFLYGLALFFSNFGANTTTFIVPAELFPARFRSTCFGISAAVGKVGAIVGAVGFYWASHKDEDEDEPNRVRMTAALVILAGVSIVGMMTTYFFTRETTGRSLEENEKEDDPEDGFFIRGFGRSCMRRRSNSVGQEDPTA